MFLSSRGLVSGNFIGLHVFVSNEMDANEFVTSASGLNEKAPLRVLYQVDPGGFEPPAFSMPLRRAPNCAMGPVLSTRLLRYLRGSFHPSGPEGIRTPGLLSAIEARSQLRYRPLLRVNRFYSRGFTLSRHSEKFFASESNQFRTGLEWIIINRLSYQ